MKEVMNQGKTDQSNSLQKGFFSSAKRFFLEIVANEKKHLLKKQVARITDVAYCFVFFQFY